MSKTGDTATAASSVLPPRIAGYRIERLIGEGGMGSVYEAWQERPHRRVALKLLRPGLMSPALLRRFSIEVEILGRLEHPAIARIYEAGSADIGGAIQPYFAMEFIEGRPITQFVREANLSTRDRVALLKSVVEGVHHAHQKGVIHRDLKPGNILVDGQGQPKILDFGVARSADADLQARTLAQDTGGLVGTLSYMSPEQASGDVNAVDVRSDVYALGMIAFEVLTGERAYRIEPLAVHEAIRLIHEQEPTRLGQVARALRGDLEIIVGKAIEKDRDRRYASASALAADFERYLNDAPIEARPPSVWYHARKFARRHKVLMGAGAMTLVALAGGLALAGVGLMRARRAEVSARRAEAEAIAQHERAQANLRKALDTVDQFTTFVARGDLANIPEAAPAREELLRDAVAFYQQLAADNAQDTRLREELSWALTRLSDASRATGGLADSSELLQQRIAELNALIEREPGKPVYLRDLARSWNNLGAVFNQGGAFAKARDAHQKAIAILEGLVEQEPGIAEYQRDLARSREELGKVLARDGDLRAALPLLEQACIMKERLLEQDPGNPEFRRDLARSESEIGRIHAQVRNTAAAQAALEKANALYREVVERHPENPEYRMDLARSWGELGENKAQAEDYAGALDALEHAGGLFESLVEQNPHEPDFLRSLARNWDELGHTHERAGDLDAARAAHEQAVHHYLALVQQNAQQADYRRDLARSWSELAHVQDLLGDTASAASAFEEAYGLYAPLLEANPTSRGLRMDMGYMLGNRARIETVDAARESLESARRIWTQLVREYPGDDSLRRALAWTETQRARLADNTATQAPPGDRAPHAQPPSALLPAVPAAGAPGDLRLDASDTDTLRQSAGQQVTVRGRIQSVRREVGRNELTFLQFGTARFGFVGIIHRNVLPAFLTAFGEDLGQLPGQDVEIAGIVSVHQDTPQIVLNRPDQVRLLGQSPVVEDRSPIASRSVTLIRARAGQHVIVEGTVSRVNATADGSLTFLEFENKFGDKFTAVIRAEHLAPIMEALGGHPSEQLTGHRVRIAGVPYLHNGNPNIEIRDPDQIERLGEPATPRRD